MELQKLRKTALEETRKKLSAADEGRKIISIFRSLEKINSSLIFLKEAIKSNEGIPFEADEGIDSLENIKLKKEEELKKEIESFMPETCKAAGFYLSAKLLEKSGALQKLAEMPSSKIQLLGAEKALFRHLKEGSKSPKHGIISMHESIKHSDNKGKAARQLSAAIMKAVRIDYYRK